MLSSLIKSLRRLKFCDQIPDEIGQKMIVRVKYSIF